MSYSNFGQRLGAYLIDFLLLSPLFALQIWASGQSRAVAMAATLLVNDQRRTLHDFIAGTVVTRTHATQPAAPSAPAA